MSGEGAGVERAWGLGNVGRGLLRGAAWGLASQPIPWLRWWIAGPGHQSLRGQWHECLHAFVVFSVAMATIELMRIHRRGMPRRGRAGQGAG